MKCLAPVILSLLLFMAIGANGQGVFIYDQQSADENADAEEILVLQLNRPMGQSFTPTLSSVGFVRLLLADAGPPGNGLGATVYVNIRVDSIMGPILGATEPVFMRDGFGQGTGNRGYTNCFFSTPVDVTPGETYYFEPVVQSGDGWEAGYDTRYGYPGGTLFSKGVPSPSSDLWFREGVYTPEPSAAMLLLLAAGLYVFRRVMKGSPHYPHR
jgi:hypothetical protein